MRGTAMSHAGLGQILMDERNRHRVLAHSGGAALDRSAANVARREYPLQARLQAVRLPRKSLPGVFLGRGSVQRSPVRTKPRLSSSTVPWSQPVLAFAPMKTKSALAPRR
jgi:hypothetical protein